MEMIQTQSENHLSLGDWEYCGDIFRPTYSRLQAHSTSFADHANGPCVTVRFPDPDWAATTFRIHLFILEQTPQPLQTLATNRNTNGAPSLEATLPLNVCPLTFEVVYNFLYCKEIAMGEVPSLSRVAVLADMYNLDTLFQICLHLLLRRKPEKLITLYMPLVSIISLPPIFREYVAIKAGEGIHSLTNRVEWRPRDHLSGPDADFATSQACNLFRDPPHDGSILNEYDLWDMFATQGTLSRAMVHAITFCKANCCSTVLQVLSHFEDNFSNEELFEILNNFFWRSVECRNSIRGTAAFNLSPRVLEIVTRAIENTAGYNDFQFRWDCPKIPSRVPDRHRRRLTPFIESNLDRLQFGPKYQHPLLFGDLNLSLALYLHECWFPGFSSHCGCALRIHAVAPFDAPANRVVQICVFLTDSYRCACLLKENLDTTRNGIDRPFSRRLISNFERQGRDRFTVADFENSGFVFEVMRDGEELRRWMQRHTRECGLRLQIMLKVQNENNNTTLTHHFGT